MGMVQLTIDKYVVADVGMLVLCALIYRVIPTFYA